MKKFTTLYQNVTLLMGRVTPQGIMLLGTAFLISEDGKIATTHHLFGNDTSNLAVIPNIEEYPNGYQNMGDKRVTWQLTTVLEIDPIRDIAILRLKTGGVSIAPRLRDFDKCEQGDRVDIYGFPHSPQGRRAFTYQSTEIGAKVLMPEGNVECRYAVINTQARPGQSGSPVTDPTTGDVLGMLIGAWVPGASELNLAGINPLELHQTTQCISAEHIRKML